MTRLLAAFRRWQLARHQRAMNATYAPRLSAYRSIVETAKAEERKVPLNLQVYRVERRLRRIA